MKFELNRAFSIVDADKAKIYEGEQGWFAQRLSDLEHKVTKSTMHNNEYMDTLFRVLPPDMTQRFETTIGASWSLFYPAPKSTYHPFSDFEMLELVGKTIYGGIGGQDKYRVTAVIKKEGFPIEARLERDLGNGMGYVKYLTAEALVECCFFFGGVPCGVGDWTYK